VGCFRESHCCFILGLLHGLVVGCISLGCAWKAQALYTLFPCLSFGGVEASGWCSGHFSLFCLLVVGVGGACTVTSY
jgi:hypothetical protein